MKAKKFKPNQLDDDDDECTTMKPLNDASQLTSGRHSGSSSSSASFSSAASSVNASTTSLEKFAPAVEWEGKRDQYEKTGKLFKS